MSVDVGAAAAGAREVGCRPHVLENCAREKLANGGGGASVGRAAEEYLDAVVAVGKDNAAELAHGGFGGRKEGK